MTYENKSDGNLAVNEENKRENRKLIYSQTVEIVTLGA